MMTKVKPALLLLAPLVGLGIIASIPAQGTHSSDEETMAPTVIRDKNNKVVAPEKVDSSATDESGTTVIYDNDGNIVQPNK